jgi:hypothetical protein
MPTSASVPHSRPQQPVSTAGTLAQTRLSDTKLASDLAYRAIALTDQLQREQWPLRSPRSSVRERIRGCKLRLECCPVGTARIKPTPEEYSPSGTRTPILAMLHS